MVHLNKQRGKMRATLLGGLLFTSSVQLFGASPLSDSTRIHTTQDDWSLVKKAIAPASLFLGSTLIGHYDYEIRDFRNEIAPNYQYGYDDFLQVAPGVAFLSLRCAGIKGRSKSWKEMLSATLFSSMMSISFTEGFKNTTGRTRPYNEYERNSFPSGHTMTAFTSATLLHKEYGGISPWYSIGGYACASFVGISRILNNKHWTSDVLAGAGMGIMAGELGYIINDRLFHEQPNGITYKKGNPSFFGLNAICAPVGNDIETQIGENILRFDHKFGYGYAIEGAFFPFKHIGIGGKMTALYNIFESANPNLQLESNYRAKNYSIAPGLYLSQALSDRVLIGGKYLYGFGSSFSFNVDKIIEGVPDRILYDEYAYGWQMEGGAFLHILLYKSMALNLAANYTSSNARYQFYQFGGNTPRVHNLTMEVGLNVALN